MVISFREPLLLNQEVEAVSKDASIATGITVQVI